MGILPGLLNSPFIAWGLAALLAFGLLLLAFLRSRKRLQPRLAILIIVVVILLVLLALNLGIE
jgi:uncharacterized membrane protein